MTEMVVAVAMLAQAFRLRAAPGTQVVPKPMLSLRPCDGVPMRVEPR
jgi:hypothetical protein